MPILLSVERRAEFRKRCASLRDRVALERFKNRLNGMTLNEMKKVWFKRPVVRNAETGAISMLPKLMPQELQAALLSENTKVCVIDGRRGNKIRKQIKAKEAIEAIKL